MKRRKKKNACASYGVECDFTARFCRFLCANVRKKRALALILSVVLIGSVFPFKAAAEDPFDEVPMEITAELLMPVSEEVPPEEEPPEDDPTEEETPGEEFEQEEEEPPEEEPPEDDGDDGTGEEVKVVTVSWAIEDATIDISVSSSYVWNTETLQYEEQSPGGVALGSRRTVGASITVTNQYGCAVDYNIAYTPDNSVLTNSETHEAADSGWIENGETLTYIGTVTVTGITYSEQLADGASITLGTYSITISSADTT